jgi:hypothetical protein
MSTPSWAAPGTGTGAAAGHVTQFLATHAISYLYQGVSQVAGSIGTGTQYLNATQSGEAWIDQPWTTAAGQTTINRVEFSYGTSLNPGNMTLSLQTDSAGAPSGTILGTSLIIPGGLYPSTFGVCSFPYIVTGLVAATKYHWVFSNVANTTYYQGFYGNGTTVGTVAYYGIGATQPSSWTSLAHTLSFTVYNGIGGNLCHTYEDAGAKWTALIFATTNVPSSVATVVTTPTILGSYRALSYASGELTGVV